MGKNKVFQSGLAAGDVSFNVVPLVDVAFLMILFFILTSEMSSNAVARLVLPKVTHGMTIKAGDEKGIKYKVIVNIVSREADLKGGRDALVVGQAKEYQIGGRPFRVGDRDALINVFKVEREKARAAGGAKDDFYIIIRGDFRVNYGEVEPVLLAAAEAEIPKMNITAEMSGK